MATAVPCDASALARCIDGKFAKPAHEGVVRNWTGDDPKCDVKSAGARACGRARVRARWRARAERQAAGGAGCGDRDGSPVAEGWRTRKASLQPSSCCVDRRAVLAACRPAVHVAEGTCPGGTSV